MKHSGFVLAKPENLAKLPRDKDVIVHCDTGQQQNKAVTVLRLLGYNAYAMKWGYMSWSDLPRSRCTEIPSRIETGLMFFRR